jgi:hypothetical protein
MTSTSDSSRTDAAPREQLPAVASGPVTTAPVPHPGAVRREDADEEDLEEYGGEG